MNRFITLAIVFITVVLAGCNTVSGMGEDISRGGRAISDTADKAK